MRQYGKRMGQRCEISKDRAEACALFLQPHEYLTLDKQTMLLSSQQATKTDQQYALWLLKQTFFEASGNKTVYSKGPCCLSYLSVGAQSLLFLQLQLGSQVYSGA